MEWTFECFLKWIVITCQYIILKILVVHEFLQLLQLEVRTDCFCYYRYSIYFYLPLLISIFPNILLKNDKNAQRIKEFKQIIIIVCHTHWQTSLYLLLWTICSRQIWKWGWVEQFRGKPVHSCNLYHPCIRLCT